MIPSWVTRAIERWQQQRYPSHLTLHSDGVTIKQVEWTQVEREREEKEK